MATSTWAERSSALEFDGFSRPPVQEERSPAGGRRVWSWLVEAEAPGPAVAGHARTVAEVTDEALAVGARSDPEAFGQLYERYADRIYGLVYSRTRHAPTAEDVTAEVFFKALRGIDQYQPGRPFRAWLFQIAINAVTDHFRRQRPAVALDEAMDRAAPGASVEDHAMARAELAQVWSALDTLNDLQRTALVMRLGLDMNTADIAASMGRSEGAVKLLIHRGLRAVRKRLPAEQRAEEWT